MPNSDQFALFLLVQLLKMVKNLPKATTSRHGVCKKNKQACYNTEDRDMREDNETQINKQTQH